MKKILLVLAVAVIPAVCLAQENSVQQETTYSNIGTYTQEYIAPAQPIADYEVTIDDLVNTPWNTSNSKVQLPWYSSEDYNGAQLLDQLSITLEKGQNLTIYFVNNESVLNKVTAQLGEGLESREVEFHLQTLNYGGWDSYLIPGRGRPLGDTNDSSNIKDETYITYHFQNNHSGKTRLEFAYCIDDHGIKNNNRCNENGKKINVKNIIVTTK